MTTSWDVVATQGGEWKASNITAPPSSFTASAAVSKPSEMVSTADTSWSEVTT